MTGTDEEREGDVRDQPQINGSAFASRGEQVSPPTQSHTEESGDQKRGESCPSSNGDVAEEVLGGGSKEKKAEIQNVLSLAHRIPKDGN